jgi:hypothetical protein
LNITIIINHKRSHRQETTILHSIHHLHTIGLKCKWIKGAFSVQSPIWCNRAIKMIWAVWSVNCGSDPNSPASTVTKLPVSENPPKHLTTPLIYPQSELPSSPNRSFLVSRKRAWSQSTDHTIRPGVRKKVAGARDRSPSDYWTPASSGQFPSEGREGTEDPSAERETMAKPAEEGDCEGAQVSRLEDWRRGWRESLQVCRTLEVR